MKSRPGASEQPYEPFADFSSTSTPSCYRELNSFYPAVWNAITIYNNCTLKALSLGDDARVAPDCFLVYADEIQLLEM